MMSGPATRVPTHFWRRLCEADRALLLLDYDGTLAPFRTERDQAVPYPGVRELLTAIRAETATRLVIVSGRDLEALIPLLDISPLPELWGCHGWELYRPETGRQPGELTRAARTGLDEAIRLAREKDTARSIEIKPAAVAFHWRGLEDADRESARATMTSAWIQLTRHGDLELHAFDGGLELRPAGVHKGRVVERILAEEQKNGIPIDRLPIAYLGDDLTDEDAFQALKGIGLTVLVRTEIRSTAADVHLIPPEELLAFLRTWLETAPGRGDGGERAGKTTK